MNRLSRPFLAAILQNHEAEFLLKWESSLTFNEQFTLFRLSGSLKEMLRECFQDLVALLKGHAVSGPGHVCQAVPIPVPGAMVHAFIMGEGVCVDLIQKYASPEVAEWPVARAFINETFREMILLKLPPLCGRCFQTIREELGGLRKLAAELRKSHTRKSATLSTPPMDGQPHGPMPMTLAQPNSR